MSGTSQATPHVAGIAALLMEKYPDESSAAIRQRLTDQALDLGDPGHDVLYGHGLVQFSAQPSQQPAPDEEPETEPDQEEDTQDETTENDTENTEDTDTSAEETDENTENESDTEEPDSEPEENTENRTDETEDSEPDEEVTDEEPADEEKSESDEDNTDEEPSEDEDNTDEQQNRLDQRSTVWVRPSETNGLATVADEDIEAVAENGVLAVSFDASLGSIDRISLSEDQVASLKRKDITLLVARADLEWLIPSENLSEGDAFITFESARSNYAHEELTKGKILSFGIEQNGSRIEDFPSDMIYRFFTPQAEYNGDHLYEWNESQESWELLGDKYTKGGVVGVKAETGTLAVFDPEELESAVAAETNQPEEENDDTTEESEVEQPESDSENDESYFAETSQGLPIVLSSVVVVLLSVTGGFYFFGGKSGS
ncbi:MAG: S8 family serine peptidase [Alkalibacterium sp.]|nr:S8 family serine peptidase [Alkalibacterium sp.]